MATNIFPYAANVSNVIEACLAYTAVIYCSIDMNASYSIEHQCIHRAPTQSLCVTCKLCVFNLVPRVLERTLGTRLPIVILK